MLKGRFIRRSRIVPSGKPQQKAGNTGSVRNPLDILRRKIKGKKNKKPKVTENKKPQVTKNVTKNRKSPLRMGDSVFFESFSGKELGYSAKGKQIVRENPGLISSVLEISRTQKPMLEDPKGRFTIYKGKSKFGFNTNATYVLDLKGKKYFIKEQNNAIKGLDTLFEFDTKYYSGYDGVSEHIAIELLKKHKINVIPAHISYVDPVSKKSFIVYEYTKLRTLDELNHSKVIKPIKYQNIVDRLKKIDIEINRDFQRHGLKKYERIWDLDPENVFMSGTKGNNKFYIFDPILVKKKR